MPDSPSLAAFKRRFTSLDQAGLKAVIERRHPEYHANVGQWSFLEATYAGGREWFPGNIFKYVKEGVEEYSERVTRAYRFNHTRETVDLVNKYIFKGEVARKEDDASEHVKTVWASTSLNRRPIQDFMKLVSRGASTFGRIWVCLDSNQSDANATLLQEQASGARVYGYTIKPQNVLDLAYDLSGDLSWITIRETYRDDSDPFSSGTVGERFRIWTPEFWALIVKDVDPSDSSKVTYALQSAGEHGLGRIPVFASDHNPTDNPYVTTGLIDDIAYLDRAVANYLSNIDAIIQDQTFSQLVMPAQAMLPGDDSLTKLLELGTKRMFTYDATGGQAPSFISPDAAQASLILAVVEKIISEIYHSIGMAGERTKQDNSMGIDSSSGVAKAYDFDRMNAMLASKARSLEITENTLCELVDTWFGKTVEPGTYKLVSYPDNFDVRGLSDELDLASSLLLVQAPDMMRKKQMETVVDKLFPNLPQDVIKSMKAEIEKSWPPVEVLPATSPPTAQIKEKRQGQVTSKTGTTSA